MTAAAAALSPLCPVIKDPHGCELISPTSDSSSSLFFFFSVLLVELVLAVLIY